MLAYEKIRKSESGELCKKFDFIFCESLSSSNK